MHRDEIPIAHPCALASGWSRLEGDERKRFCTQCSRHVHDLSAMSEPDARELVSTQDVCVRYTVDTASGRILHWPMLAVGAALLSAPAQASTAPAEGQEPGWLPWLVAQAHAWWTGEPATVPGTPGEPGPPVTTPLPTPIDPRTIEPRVVLGGVPVSRPEPTAWVEDKTGRDYKKVESTCCGTGYFDDGRAGVVVRPVGYVWLEGEYDARVRIKSGETAVCELVDDEVACSVVRR